MSPTRREAEVLHLLASGMSTRAMAERLCVSIKTVESHCQHLEDKSGVRTLRELTVVAVWWSWYGLVPKQKERL